MKEEFEKAIRRIREYDIRNQKEYTQLAKRLNLLSIESIQYIAGENFNKILKKIREVKIRNIPKKEEKIEKVNKLLRRILEEQVSKVYTPEGVKQFIQLIENKDMTKKLKFYGAYIKEELVGVAVTTRDGNRIILLGVDVQHQNLGIGRRLYKEVIKNRTANEIIANPTPVAIEVCKKFGFKSVGKEGGIRGMTYSVMKAVIEE